VALLLASAGVAAPAQADTTTVSAYGVDALKSEWLAGYNSADGLDVNGLFDLDLMGNNNLKLYRARFRQDQVLSDDGTYSKWTMLDHLAKQAALRDVTLQAILINMPNEQYTPPTTDAARTSFAEFAAAAAGRYGPNGTFWPGCACTPHPVKVWEVWNEENIAPYWSPPDPSQYGALLSRVRTAVRTVDPTARILFGGLAYPSSDGSGTNAFLQQAIGAAGSNGFDALAVHLYDPDAAHGVNTLIKGTVETLKTYAGTDSSGAPRQQVWLNEFGRPTLLADKGRRGSSTLKQQSDWLKSVLTNLLPQRGAWNLGPVSWYSLRDYKYATDSSADAWLRLGLRFTNADDTDGGPKPAWGDYTKRSRAAAPLPLPVPR